MIIINPVIAQSSEQDFMSGDGSQACCALMDYKSNSMLHRLLPQHKIRQALLLRDLKRKFEPGHILTTDVDNVLVLSVGYAANASDEEISSTVEVLQLTHPDETFVMLGASQDQKGILPLLEGLRKTKLLTELSVPELRKMIVSRGARG